MAEPIFYVDAPEVREIAEGLIPKHHQHLIDLPIRYVFRSKTRKLRGSLAYATAEVMKGREAVGWMTEDEVQSQYERFQNPYQIFWMEVSAQLWETLSDPQKIALIDHELCHFIIEEDDLNPEPRLGIKPHDIEEFTDVVRRHGLWEPGLVEFGAAAFGLES